MMKKTILINFVILISAIPISGIIAVSTGLGTQRVGETTFNMMMRYAFSPLTSDTVTVNVTQTIILLGPLLGFLVLTIISTWKNWEKISKCFAVLTGCSWLHIVLCHCFAMAMGEV